MKKRGFTLAEVLITLAIIGVVAAISIPSVISNTQQQEFKTGLRKAVSVLNSAITMNMAIDGESPYDNANIFGYLTRHMNVIKTTSRREYEYRLVGGSSALSGNAAFYTVDGMVFELRAGQVQAKMPLYENNSINVCTGNISGDLAYGGTTNHCGGCGSYGLNNNADGTTKPPCIILVDVNGDRKPTPNNVNCKNATCASADNITKVPLPSEKKVRDTFSILITDDRAIPFGVTAQKAMYQAQK